MIFKTLKTYFKQVCYLLTGTALYTAGEIEGSKDPSAISGYNYSEIGLFFIEIIKKIVIIFNTTVSFIKNIALYVCFGYSAIYWIVNIIIWVIILVTIYYVYYFTCKYLLTLYYRIWPPTNPDLVGSTQYLRVFLGELTSIKTINKEEIYHLKWILNEINLKLKNLYDPRVNKIRLIQSPFSTSKGDATILFDQAYYINNLLVENSSLNKKSIDESIDNINFMLKIIDKYEPPALMRVTPIRKDHFFDPEKSSELKPVLSESNKAFLKAVRTNNINKNK